MAQVKYEQNSYVDELKNEMSVADPSSHAARLLQADHSKTLSGAPPHKGFRSFAFDDFTKITVGVTPENEHKSTLIISDLDKLGCVVVYNSVGTKFLSKKFEEITRLEQGGGKEKDKNAAWINVHPNSPQTIAVRVYIPVKEYPKFNFVGKLLGPKGNSLKRLQDETGTKMSILGRGSMRDRQKEEEMRKEGGKYAHLNEDLHVLVEAYAEITDAYQRIAHAVAELKKFMTPEDFNDEIRQAQMQELMYMNGEKSTRGARGGFRGAPRGRGGGAPPHAVPPVPAPPPPPRGALGSRGSVRGAPTGRGAPSRGAPPGRGAPRGRAAAPPPAPQAYDDYGSSSYDDYGDAGYGDQSYDQGYGSAEHGRAYKDQGRYDDQRYRQDSSYYDYGHGSSAGGYDDYGEGGWGAPSSGGPVKPTAVRGGSKGQYRSHPYGSSRGGY